MRQGFTSRAGGSEEFGPTGFGIVLRDNQWTNAVVSAIDFQADVDAEMQAGSRAHVVERNTIESAPLGILIGQTSKPDGLRGALVRDNQLDRGDAPQAGSVGLRVCHPDAATVSGNSYIGYEVDEQFGG